MDMKPISPLLDNIIMGEPIYDIHGIRCCPALNQETEQRYIVKIISVPASQTQLDALLLTGAVKDMDAADAYFKERVTDYTREIDVLQDLSRSEGFLPYSGYQIVPKDDNAGYDIYVLSEYRVSLERQFTKKPFSKLNALNLGLDICSALTACRRNGYIFTNLKPANIYITDNGEYKISGFGFLKLSSLKYATVAEHYIGEYTAPEITDAFSSVNEQLDVYSLGMILYRIYNGGSLPQAGKAALESPAYADAELSQIILKACSVHPEDRWQDPAEMGQQLVSYMQKNGVEDLPIVPLQPEPVCEEAEEPQNEEMPELPADIDFSDAQIQEDEIEEPAEDTAADAECNTPEEVREPDAAEEASKADTLCENIEPSVIEQITFEEYTPEENVPEEPAAENSIAAEEDSPLASDDADESIQSEEMIPAEQPQDSEPTADESENPEEADDSADEDPQRYEGVTDEVNEILSMADSLAALQVPEPVVAPEAREIVLPGTDEGSDDEADTSDNTAEDEEVTEMEYYVDIPEEPRKSHLVRNIILIALLLGLLLGGFLFYKFYVLQTVDKMTVTGAKDRITVKIQSDIDENLLCVSCSAVNNMINITAPVINGEANFSGLAYSSEYVVELKISGLHILKGDNIKQTHYTPQQIKIDKYNILTGSTSGSAILSFSLPSAEEGTNAAATAVDSAALRWKFTYGCAGEATKTAIFQGTSVTLSGLNKGKVYHGVLELDGNAQYVSEPLDITFTPSEIIQAYDLTIVSCTENKLKAQWNAPENVLVDSWLVRCYNDRGYDQSFTTANTYAEFSDLDSSEGFTVEVSATDQSVKQTATVGANSVTVSKITADSSQPGIIDVTWESSAVPANGWIISYTVGAYKFEIPITGSDKAGQIKPAIPGEVYSISVRSGDSVQTLCQGIECTTPAAKDFTIDAEDKTVTADNMIFSLCKRPDNANWTYKDAEESLTNQFKASQNGGIVIRLKEEYELIDQELTVAYVIYDAQEQIISVDSEQRNWSSMWNESYCCFNMPKLPEAVGSYGLALYINGAMVKILPFTIA